MSSVISGSRKREARVQSEIEALLRGLGYDVEREYATGDGPADLYLPTRRTIIETKGQGQAGPDKPGSREGENQEQQCERYVIAENERERRRLDLSSTGQMPWQVMLTDGQLWWLWEWQINHDGSLSQKRLADRRSFYSGQDAEALYWLQSKTDQTTGKPWVPADPAALRSLFDGYLAELQQIYRHLNQEQSVLTKRQLWLDTLRGSGCAPAQADQDGQFLAHTLLITIARAVISTLSNGENKPVPVEAMNEGFASWPQARNETGPTFQTGIDWTNRVFETADAYDWRQRAMDVLRTLYEGLIEKSQRKAFGEYYTPDWLAGMLAERVIDEEWMEKAISQYMLSSDKVEGIGILDPACGSGTFLFHAAQRILNSKAMMEANVNDVQKADFIARMVNGIDIHPIASEISRATLLRALPAEPSGGINALQVYQGDSLIYNRQNLSLAYNPNLPFFTITSPKGTEISIPIAFAENPLFGQNVARFVEAANSDGRIPPGIFAALSEKEITTLENSFEATKKVCREEGNSVWAWYILNSIAPATLSRRKVDRILSNPPWVVLLDIQVEERRKELESLAAQLGIRAPRGNFDIAGLFVKRCRENFLINGGSRETKAAWVLNRAALSATNWKRVRDDQANFNAEWLDFSNVKIAPFSGASSCAWVQIGGSNLEPQIWEYNNRSREDRVLPTTDWREANSLLEVSLAPEKLPTAQSGYLDNRKRPVFKSGFKLEPHCLVKIQEFDTNGDVTNIRTSSSRHEPWKSEGVQRGEIPTRWVRDIAHPSALVPFNLGEFKAVVPLNSDGSPDGDRQENAYWQRAETIYNRHQTLGDQTPGTLFDRLNFQEKLLAQSAISESGTDSAKVAYNKSGQTLRAARFPANVVAESSLYFAVVGSVEEAAYLTSVLNAPCLQRAFRQSKKSDRHFDQQFWHTVPIPRYNPRLVSHRALVKLCEKAEKVSADTKKLVGGDAGQEKLSTAIRRELIKCGIAGQIDRAVRRIVPRQSERAYRQGYNPWFPAA